jgi:hypothetical protein
MAGTAPEGETLQDILKALYRQANSEHDQMVEALAGPLFDAVWESAKQRAALGAMNGTFALALPPGHEGYCSDVFRNVLKRFREGRVEASFEQRADNTICGIKLVWAKPKTTTRSAEAEG